MTVSIQRTGKSNQGFRMFWEHMGVDVEITAETTGYVEGDMGHGGFFRVEMKPLNQDVFFDIEVDGHVVARGNQGDNPEPKKIAFTLHGGSEYRMAIEALEALLLLLKANNTERAE